MSTPWNKTLKYRPVLGKNTLTANRDTPMIFSEHESEIDALLASLAGTGPESLAGRQQLLTAMAEPVMQIVPYLELYDRFFMSQPIGELEDNILPVEDIITLAFESHPATEIFFTQPGYYFTRPTFTTFDAGFKIPWRIMNKAGWNVLARSLMYLSWDIARKRDAAAKVVLDAAVPTSHKLTVTGGPNKASVDEVIERSNQIGFPVTQAVINPGLLMKMQSWTWVMPNIPQEVATQLVNNMYYGNYGGIDWFANPNASTSVIYFGGPATGMGWHQTKGTSRTDQDRDIVRGEDLYAYRDAEHAWYAQSGLSLWQITVS